MALITGRLTDFGLDTLKELDPRLTFHPNSAAVSGNRLMTKRPVTVDPAPADGFFEADLMDNDNTHPLTFYTLSIDYREEGGRRRISESLPWRVYVPAAGGALADLLRIPANPSAVWSGPTPPPSPTPGVWWLYTGPATADLTPGDLLEWS